VQELNEAELLASGSGGRSCASLAEELGWLLKIMGETALGNNPTLLSEVFPYNDNLSKAYKTYMCNEYTALSVRPGRDP
jgi:hypothetical protein